MNTMDGNKGLEKFVSLVWYDALIEFVFRFVAKTSEPLLALGVVFSAADVLSKGTLMQGNSFLLYAWAWTQAIAIESSGGVVLTYALQSFKEKDTIKGILYLVLSVLLSVVGGIMLYTQLIANTSGTTEIGASGGVNAYVIIMSALRSIVSIGYVVMCRTKNIRFSGFTKDIEKDEQISSQTPHISVEEIRAMVSEMVTSVVTNITLQVENCGSDRDRMLQHCSPEQISLAECCESEEIHREKQKLLSVPKTNMRQGEQPNFVRVKEFLHDSPHAKVREVADALQISTSTANKWMLRVRAKQD